jgi:hypothetical protein
MKPEIIELRIPVIAVYIDYFMKQPGSSTRIPFISLIKLMVISGFNLPSISWHVSGKNDNKYLRYFL